jgi:hypothetical protein
LLVETSGSEDFAGTRAFYNSIGYTQEARIRDFYQGGDDKIVFRKDLSFSVRFTTEKDIETLQGASVGKLR